MSKLSEVIVLHQVGMKPMSFRTKMTKDDFFDALNEQGRVFRLQMRSWDAETGETEIALVPGNGVMALYEGYDPPIEDPSPTLPPEGPELG
jgi:hypothetical protein